MPTVVATHAALGLARIREQALDGRRALLAHEAAKLPEDLAARRLVAEREAGDPDHDEEERRDGEERVIRQRRPHAGRVVLAPGVDRLPEKRDHRLERHGQHHARAQQ